MTSTYKTAKTLQIDVNGTPFAYRRLGPAEGIPLVFLHHFTAVLDDWDPRVVDGLAATRPVITFDNRGVGASGGVTPTTVEAMAEDAIAFLDALGVETCDLFGFSMGGFVAQVILERFPDRVRKAILAGTGPAGGAHNTKPAMVAEVRRKAAEEGKHPKHYLFFTQTENGQAAANAYLARLAERTENRDTPVTEATIAAHLTAIVGWGETKPQDLTKIRNPVLVANGDDDVMVPTPRSFDMVARFPAAQLSIFPDAGHAGVFQYHEEFVRQATVFLA
ncbi:alpha/beta fold hydrolase [Sphingomonas kyeonggiensis]|uniref:Pimeloyl-ACP methyl ester carboxylesterase n=1 Tax=Sphingomonas kyeonggiensis TaxID=1268553 RepID=A0A7W6JR31_9SPHN|nr:alpha/beta hydrolase [Sphingomonas kyeonggiensis]MBB4097965.1 pimeloyl-ACP methyl ester carboxylesterase [Sphingomonas kyeonggiensis]